MTPAEVRLLTRVLSAFEHRTFRGRLRRHAALPAAVFLAAFAASLHLGDGAGTTDGTAALEVIAGATMTPWQIFANNAGVLLAIFVGGVLTFTVGAVFVLVKNAVHFGWGVSLLAEAYGTTVAFAALLPHGVLETAAFLVVAAASMRVSVLVAWSRVGLAARPPVGRGGARRRRGGAARARGGRRDHPHPGRRRTGGTAVAGVPRADSGAPPASGPD
jgi:hypothetical protein